MKISKVSTAAFLAGATTLAVTLPAIAQGRVYQLSGFDQVEISSGISVDVMIGPDFEVTAQAGSRRTLNRLDISVQDGKLVVTRSGGWLDYSLFSPPRDVTVQITLPTLTAIEAKAGSDVFVTGDYGDSLTAQVSSGAEIDLENVKSASLRFSAASGSDLRADGVCGSLDVSTSGGASILTTGLSCSEVSAHASSGSEIQAYASSAAVVSASSGGLVRISGEPEKIVRNERSGGNVIVN